MTSPFPKVICFLYILELSLIILIKNKLYNVNIQKNGRWENQRLIPNLSNLEAPAQLGSQSLHPATKQNHTSGPPQILYLFVLEVVNKGWQVLKDPVMWRHSPHRGWQTPSAAQSWAATAPAREGTSSKIWYHLITKTGSTIWKLKCSAPFNASRTWASVLRCSLSRQIASLVPGPICMRCC